MRRFLVRIGIALGITFLLTILARDYMVVNAQEPVRYGFRNNNAKINIAYIDTIYGNYTQAGDSLYLFLIEAAAKDSFFVMPSNSPGPTDSAVVLLIDADGDGTIVFFENDDNSAQITISGDTLYFDDGTAYVFDADIELQTGATVEAGKTDGTLFSGIKLLPIASTATGSITRHQLLSVGDVTGNTAWGFGDVTKTTRGIMGSFGRTVQATGDWSGTDTGLTIFTINKLVNDAAYNMQAANFKAKNYGTGTVGSLTGIHLEVVADGTETSSIALDISGDSSTLDDVINMRSVTATYGIDMDAATLSTAEIRFQNEETLDNTIDGLLLATADTLRVTGDIRAEGLLMSVVGGSIPSWGHAPTGAGIEGSVEIDGALFVDNSISIPDNYALGFGVGSDVAFSYDYNSGGDYLFMTLFKKLDNDQSGTWWIARDLNPSGLTDHDDYLSPTFVVVNDEGADANDYSYVLLGPRTTADCTVAWYWDILTGTGAADGTADGTNTELGTIFRTGASGTATSTNSLDAGDWLFEGDIEVQGTAYFEAGFTLKEGTTSGAIDINSSDQIILTGNDGAGVLIGADFAGIYLWDTATVVTIALTDAYEKITVFTADMPEVTSNGAHGTDDITIGATGIYEVVYHIDLETATGAKVFGIDIFEIAATASGTAITGITKAATGVVTTSAAHGLSDGNRVKLGAVVGMTEVTDNIYTVANKTATTFELNDDEGIAINTSGYGAVGTDGYVYLATRLTALHAHSEFAVQDDARTSSAGGYVSVTGSNTVEAYVKNVTDATNISISTGQFTIKRIQ